MLCCSSCLWNSTGRSLANDSVVPPQVAGRFLDVEGQELLVDHDTDPSVLPSSADSPKNGGGSGRPSSVISRSVGMRGRRKQVGVGNNFPEEH